MLQKVCTTKLGGTHFSDPFFIDFDPLFFKAKYLKIGSVICDIRKAGRCLIALLLKSGSLFRKSVKKKPVGPLFNDCVIKTTLQSKELTRRIDKL